MYLFFIGETFTQYESMPVKIRLADGMTRTSLDELTEQGRNDLGLYEYVDETPSYDPATHYPTGEITWDHTDRTFVRTIAEKPVPEPVAKRFTQLEYQSLYTLDELVAVETAAETDPVLRVLQRMQMAASYVSLDDPRTVQGMQVLVAKSLLTQARYDEILTHVYDV